MVAFILFTSAGDNSVKQTFLTDTDLNEVIVRMNRLLILLKFYCISSYYSQLYSQTNQITWKDMWVRQRRPSCHYSNYFTDMRTTSTRMEDFNISLTNHSNTSSRYYKYDESDSNLVEIAKLFAYVFIIVLGMLSNAFVIILAAKYTVRTNLHHLIINMAVGDVLFLFAGLLFNISYLTGFKNCNVIFGIVICAVARFLLDVSYKVSLISLLVISIERFRATRRTLTRSRPYTFRRRIMAICVSSLIPLPFAAYFLYEDHHGWRDEDFQHFFSTDNILHVILCFVIFVLCVLTIRRLSRPQAIQSHLNQQQRNVRRRQTQAAVRMVLVSVLLYTCCWLPIFFFYKFSVIETLTQRVFIIDFSVCIDWDSFHFIINSILPVVNSSFSPLIYLIFLPDFRQAAKKVLCRRNIQNQAPNRQN